jgi:TPR repeat protein
MGMNRTIKVTVAGLMIVVSIAASVALLSAWSEGSGPFKNAIAAYEKGDYPTALRLMRPLAEHGDAVAQHNLGVMYATGHGVPQDYATAASWYRKAAGQGYADAQVKLGKMYDKGQGVPQDQATAMSWYRRAAAQGDGVAPYILGDTYLIGRGVQQDYVTAHMWLNLAAAKGNKDAEKGRDRVATWMTPAQVAEAQKAAREWLPTAEDVLGGPPSDD